MGVWPVPFQVGGLDDTEEVEFQALLDAYAPGWDVSSDTELSQELAGDAFIIACVWDYNERARNQVEPLKMIDLLPDWEGIMRIIPRPDSDLVERRRSISARLRSAAKNRTAEVERAAQDVLGAAFVAVVYAVEADVWWYMPGVNPGPPGMPFASNRSTVCIHAADNVHPRPELLRRRATMLDQLSNILPSYMTYDVGVGNGATGSFVCGKGITGLTVL